MFESRALYHQGRHYVLFERFAPLDGRLGRVLSRFEAERVLGDLMHDGAACAGLRGAYADLTSAPVMAHLANGEVLGWLIGQLRDEMGGGRLAVVERDPLSPAKPEIVVQSVDQKEAQRIDALLTELGSTDLVHRGNSYRLVRVLMGPKLPNRDRYEAASEREASAVLKEMVEDPTRSERPKPALRELSTLFDKLRGKRALELLLLRRTRMYARPVEQGPAVTPSQLRERHFIAVEAVSAAEEPVSGVALEFVLPDGSVKTGSTDAAGIARVNLAQAGSVIIRVPGIDASSWRAVGGLAATPSGKAGPARSHVVKQGECLSKIAQKYGFPKWETVWEHGTNASLRKKRKSPHVLFPGDNLSVPGIAVSQMTRDADATHRIEIKKADATVELSLSFRDSEGKALDAQAFELRWGKGSEPRVKGTLDGSGALKERVPVSVARVELLLPERGERYMLATSHLNPMEDEAGVYIDSGVASRLSALGYLHKLPEEATAAAICDAIQAFQREAMGQSEPTGELDSATCQKLEELYGV